MAIEKTLLLKGLAGVAALGGVGGVGGVVIKNKLDERAAEEKKKEDEQKNLEEINSKKKAKKEEVNGKLKTLGIEGCVLGDKDVTSPTTFTKECQLTKDQLQAINFSNKPEASNVTVEGWNNQNGKINLNISNKPGEDNGIKFTFSGAPSNLIIKGGDNKFSIRTNKETEFEEKPDNKLSKVVNETLKTKLEGYNTKLGNLSLPASCRFDDTEDEKKLECEIKGSELKTVNFTNKGAGQLTLSGLDEAGKIKLIIDREGSETSETLKYKFKNDSSSKIILTGTEGDPNNFSIKASSETEFEEKGGKLSKIISDTATSEKLKNYNAKFKTLSLPASCVFDVTEPNTSLECDVTGSELKNIKFSNKGDSDSLTLKGITDSEKIKLIIERSGSETSESLKYKLKNDKSSSITLMGKVGEQKKIVLKASSETEFENKNDEKLSKIISNQETSTKLKEHNEKLEKLSLPDDCIFDVAETDTSLECDVTTANITKIKFSNKGDNDLTISEGNDFTGLKLNISESGNDLKFNFKSGSENIKLSNVNKHVFIKQGKESEFKIKGEALHKVLSSNVSEMAEKVDLVCEYGDSGDGGECKKGDNKSYLNVSKKNESNYETIGIGGGGSNYKKEDVKFNFQEDQAGYERGVKFTFTGETMVNSYVKLEKNVSYEIKTIGGFDCFSRKDPQ